MTPRRLRPISNEFREPQILNAKVNGIRLAYFYRAGDPVIAYPVPYGLSVAALSDIPRIASWFEEMSADCGFLMFDQRGAGRSGRPRSGYTWSVLAKDAIALLDLIDIQRVVAYGLNNAAYTALHLSVFHPSRVSALILTDTCAEWRGMTPTAKDALTSGDASQLAALLALGAIGSEAVTLSHYYERTSAAIRKRIEALLRTTDVRELLPLVNVPTLLLHNKASKFFPISAARDLDQRIATSTFFPFRDKDFISDKPIRPIHEFVAAQRIPAESDKVDTFLLQDHERTPRQRLQRQQ